MQFRLQIQLGNDAVLTPDALPTLLREVADKLERGHTRGGVYDLNGNTVGRFVTDK